MRREWIPAFAEMTWRWRGRRDSRGGKGVDSRLRGNDLAGGGGGGRRPKVVCPNRPIVLDCRRG